MRKKDSKRDKRIKKLIVSCGLCAIILAISTYAWFIGMKTVNVDSFKVGISSIDSLYLSLDGETWSNDLTITKENLFPAKYGVDDGNTNTFAESGLIPMSSVGRIDDESSRLKLYQKGSLTATDGGYRIMASRVKNTKTDAKEADGYVAFDLFIKNLSGKEYYKEFNYNNEEAIYLTPESKVTVKPTDGLTEGEEDPQLKTGIENSVRVAFSQIGRISADGDDATNGGPAREISCDSTNADETKICSKRVAQIWEPNDTKHVKNALNWVKTSCKKRTGDDVTKADAYGEACDEFKDGTAYPTYAIGGDITETSSVDVYDGHNGYMGSILAATKEDGTAQEPADNKLYNFDYFTDSEKVIQGVNRPEFFRLAPNSITKVRVYIWIEGQDIDNYDFASLGKQISVEFGFTKEQLYGSDIGYEGEPVLPGNENYNGDIPGNVDVHPNKTPDAPIEP